MQRVVLAIIGFFIRIIRGDLKHHSLMEIIKDAEHNKDIGFEKFSYFLIIIGLIAAIYVIVKRYLF